jgi:hypothetical protein
MPALTSECKPDGTQQRTTQHGAFLMTHPKTLYVLNTRNRGTLQAQEYIQARQSHHDEAVTITKAVVSQTKE